MNREEVLSKARIFIGDKGEVRDYQCSCHPGGERFIINWNNGKYPICYNLSELISELENTNL